MMTTLFLLFLFPALASGFHISLPDSNPDEVVLDTTGISKEDADFAISLVKLFNETRESQKEFQGKFKEQQGIMAELTGKSPQGRFLQTSQGNGQNSSSPRFSQTDPQQIWRGLYDTQPLRTPASMSVNLDDKEDVKKISDEATNMATLNQASRLENKLVNDVRSMERAGPSEAFDQEILHQTQALQSAINSSQTHLMPFFRMTQLKNLNEHFTTAQTSSSAISESKNIQAVSPHISTVTVFTNTTPSTVADIPSGYYGESRNSSAIGLNFGGSEDYRVVELIVRLMGNV